MKRKVICGLILALVFSMTAPALAETKLTDVPVDHWAYHAVNTVVSKGYLTLFEDGSFQGTRAVDRYSLASVIARLLEDIEVSRVRGTTGDLTAIGDLRTRFEEDLATWYADQQSLRDSVKRVEENALAAEERVSRVVAAQVALEEELAALRKEIVAQQLTIAGFEGMVAEQTGDLGDLSANLSEHGQRISELLNAVLVLEKEVLRQGDEITRLENWIGEKDAVFATLQGSDADLASQLEQLAKNNQQLEKDIQNLAVMLRSETQKREELASQLDATKSELVVLREDRSMMEDIKQELGADVNAQLNAALIREQRLERQIKTLEEEFNAYRTNAEQELKSTKTLAIVGIAVGAIGAVVGLIMSGGFSN
ncbi:MAG: hypothetical protein GX199_08165 [Firmicutes bacterium]|nr:hypothetical protein [Bacillota bacterium]